MNQQTSKLNLKQAHSFTSKLFQKIHFGTQKSGAMTTDASMNALGLQTNNVNNNLDNTSMKPSEAKNLHSQSVRLLQKKHYYSRIPKFEEQNQDFLKSQKQADEIILFNSGSTQSLSSQSQNTDTSSPKVSRSQSTPKAEEQPHYRTKYAYYGSSSSKSSPSASKNLSSTTDSPRQTTSSTAKAYSSPSKTQQNASQGEHRIKIARSQIAGAPPNPIFQKMFIHRPQEVVKQDWLFCSFIYASNFTWRWVVLTQKTIYAYSEGEVSENNT